MEADLAGKGTVLSGLRGSGKTNAARAIALADPEHVLVYDPMDQYPEFDRIIPKCADYPEAADELARILERDVKLWDGNPNGYRLLVVDEAHRVVPTQLKLHRGLARLNHEHRHIPLAIIWVSRRPRELHPEIVNLADHLLIWRLPGATDSRFLEDTARGLSGAVAGLGRFEFVYVDQDRQFERMAPFADVSPKGG